MSKVQILLHVDEILCGITTCPLKQKRNTLSSVKRVGGIKGQGLAIVWGRSWDNCYKEIHQSGGKVGEGDRMGGGKGGIMDLLTV